MSLKQTATRLINSYGEDVKYQQRVKGAIDFDTGKAAETVTEYTVMAILGHYDSSEIVEGVINIDDVKCTIQLDFLPLKGDTVVADGVTYTVMNVRKVKRSGGVLKYTLQLRS